MPGFCGRGTGHKGPYARCWSAQFRTPFSPRIPNPRNPETTLEQGHIGPKHLGKSLVHKKHIAHLLCPFRYLAATAPASTTAASSISMLQHSRRMGQLWCSNQQTASHCHHCHGCGFCLSSITYRKRTCSGLYTTISSWPTDTLGD